MLTAGSHSMMSQSMIPGPNGTPNHLTSAPTGTDHMTSALSASQHHNRSYQVHDNTSFHTVEDLSTPAAKEGQRAALSTRSSTAAPCDKKPKSTSDAAVHLGPAVCKRLQDVAAQLWIIAHHQEYEPLTVLKFDQRHGNMPDEDKVR